MIYEVVIGVEVHAQVLELSRELQAERGMSMILITRDLGVVAGMAHRIAVMYAGRIVETASASALFARPSHPYTQGLLASVPRMHADRAAQLTPIPGLPPDLSQLPSGCPFRPRCARVVPRCEQVYPELLQIAPQHRARCLRLEEEPAP